MLRATLALAALLAGGLLLVQGSPRGGGPASPGPEASQPRPGVRLHAAALEGRVLVDDAFPASLYRLDLHPCGAPAGCSGGSCGTRSVTLAADGRFRFHATEGEPCALVFRLAGTDAPLRVLANVGRRPGADRRLAAVELRDELTWAHLDVVDAHGRSLSGVRVVELPVAGARRRLAVTGQGPVDLHARGCLPPIRILCEGYEPRELREAAGHLVVALTDAERVG